MTYSLTTGLSYFEHIQTLNAVERSGSRVETAIHSGLMSLATSQAAAMKEMGTRIDDRLVKIDDTINSRFVEIKFCLDGISEQLGRSFTAIDERLADIDKTLTRMGEGIENPEKTRAQERFRRALELYKVGHFAPALEHVDHAIANDGGPSFAHVSEFQTLKGTLHMGSSANTERSVIDPAKAHEAFLSAAKYYPVKYTGDRPDRADLYYQAGLAAYAAGNPMAAIQSYHQALEDYEAASSNYHGRSPCLAHFQIARAGLVIGDSALVRKHLTQAIDMNWKLLAAVAADPDCIAHQGVVEPIISNYVKATLPEARRELEALCYILIGGAPRNVSKMHQMIQKATFPEDVEGNRRHRALGSFESVRRFERNLDHYWRCFDIYSPYPTGLSQEQSRALNKLLRDDVGLLDIAVEMERLDSDKAITEAVKRTEEYWSRIDRILRCGLDDLETGYMPRGMTPSFGLDGVPKEPRLEAEGGFIARRRAKKRFEEAVAERERALAAAWAVINRDREKVVAMARKELPSVLAKCRDMTVRSQGIQERAERALQTLHPERRWKVDRTV